MKPAVFTKVLMIALAAGLAGCAGQADGLPTNWYATHDGVPPSREKTVVCHGFGCHLKTSVSFSPADMKALGEILAAGSASPAAEREAIARAVQWQEKRVAPIVGSANDVGGFTLHGSGVPGQMDCIDEATNTTSLLLVAERNGMLTHHAVRSPVARGFFLDGRYPHATAVVAEKASGKTFAIDSWPRANGLAPDVMTLERWFATYPQAS